MVYKCPPMAPDPAIRQAQGFPSALLHVSAMSIVQPGRRSACIYVDHTVRRSVLAGLGFDSQAHGGGRHCRCVVAASLRARRNLFAPQCTATQYSHAAGLQHAQLPEPAAAASTRLTAGASLPAAHPAAEDNLQQQADELQALQAIYGEDSITVLDAASFIFALPEPQAQPHMVLRVHLPASYPAQHPPICELSCDFLSGDVLRGLAGELEGMFAPGGFARGGKGFASASAYYAGLRNHPAQPRDAAGEVVLYNWIEHLREQWSSLAPPPAPSRESQGASAAGAAADADAALAAELQAAELLEGGSSDGQAQQRQQWGAANQADEALQAAMAEVAESVVHGEPFTEKRSTFQACVAAASRPWQAGRCRCSRHCCWVALTAAAAADLPAHLHARPPSHLPAGAPRPRHQPAAC